MSSSSLSQQPPPVLSHTTESMSDRKRSRELAEARQSGTMAPAVDTKTGAMINPHNPEFITKRPWYLGDAHQGPSLDHQADQRLESEKIELSLSSADKVLQQERQRWKEQQRNGKFTPGMWIEALKNGKQPYLICQIIKIAKKGTEFDLKFEDGTIERKVKWNPKKSTSASNAAPPPPPRLRMTKTGNRAHVVNAQVYGKETYDSKRDSHLGFDTEQHRIHMEQKFQTRDALRQKYNRRNNQTNDGAKKDGNDNKDNKHDSDNDAGSDFDDSDVEDGDDSEDEFVQRDEDAKTFSSRLARQGGVGGAQMKVTARNLRIREDTAKYLRNLDLGSAYYDPKSRSMRDNPNPEVTAEESQFAGDNFARISGDAVGLAETQLFAWDAADKGQAAIHPQANPSQAELLKKKEKSKRMDAKSQQKKAVLDKYGGAEYLDGTDGLATETTTGRTKTKDSALLERKVRFGVSVTKQEYTRDGRLLQGGVALKRAALTSKYQEDVYVNGHGTVWGSYFHLGAFRWGYADDHSLIRNSYCTGANGRKVNDEANEMKYGTGVAGSAALAQAREMLKAIPANQRLSSSGGGGGGIESMRGSSKLYGEANLNASLDQTKLDAALKKVDQQKHEASDKMKKRKYNSVDADVDVTEEEMEAYRMRKEQHSDPMAKLGSEQLLEYK